MTDEKRPEKIKDVLSTIKECIAKKKYTVTNHAFDRQNERKITFPMVLHILENGREEKSRTKFNDEKNCWNYAIRGKTIRDALDVRVIVSLDIVGVAIITVMYIGKNL